MKKLINILFLTFVLALTTVSAQQISSTQNLDEYVEKGRIRIKLNKESFLESTSLKSVSASQSSTEIGVLSVDDLSDDLGITRMYRVFPFSLKHEAKHREYGLHLWIELEFDNAISPEYVVEQYSVLSDVDIAKPVYKKVRYDGDEKPVLYEASKLNLVAKPAQQAPIMQLKSASEDVKEFNDPMLSSQWHYYNDGTKGTEGMDIDLTKAWSIATGNNDIVVAIVDGGIDVEHEDLKENVFINQAELDGEDGVDDDQNGYVDDIYGYNFTVSGPITEHDHGTHVAGTVAAISNNGVGVAGVAGGDGSGNGVKLLSCQVFDDRTEDSGNFAAAIVYGADMGAVISQNSWGYSMPGYYEPEVLEACQYFVAEAGQFEDSPLDGGILFFAAGNDGLEQTHYPATFDEVVAVSASGPEGYPAPYTNSGEWVDICAPGGDQTNYEEDGGVLSTLPNNEYGYFQGTSMSCPHVSGVAALVLSQYIEKEEEITPEELKSIIINSTSRLIFEHNDKYGVGMLNAANALADDEKIAPNRITDLEADEISHEMVRLQWTIPSDEDNFQPATLLLAVSSEEITEENFDGLEIIEYTNTFDAGTLVKVDISGLLKQTDYWFAIKTTDLFGNISDLSNILEVTTTDKPKFRIDKTKVEVEIDVSVNAIYQTNVEFSNVGEGMISWEHYVENERQYEEIQEEEEEEIAAVLDARISEVIANPDLVEVTKPTQGVNAMYLKSAQLEPLGNSYWNNDQSIYTAGLTYEEEDPYVDELWGTENPNVGSVVGTRFSIELDYTFNLTHVEVASFAHQNENPLIIDIRRGEDIESAETVYLQEYTSSIVDTLAIQRIPLYHPQVFEDGESFWVVIHFPKEDLYPIGCYYIDYIPNTFKFSYDNGRTFEEMQYMIPRTVTPLVRAMSTGLDGAYVFLDPVSGEIKSGESSTNKITIDANALYNGKHVASLTVLTNDDAKIYNTIEVEATIVGHKGELDTTTVHEFSVFNLLESELVLDIENIGYSHIEVYDVSSNISGISANFTDTLNIYSKNKADVPFKINYNSNVTGWVEGTIELDTNEGEFSIPVRFSIKSLAQTNVALANSTINMVYGETKQVELLIENTGLSFMEYNLEHYSSAKLAKGQLGSKLSYTISSSDEVGGPDANQWFEIEDIGQHHHRDEANADDSLEFDFQFPYFDELFLRAKHSTRADLYLYSNSPNGAAPLPDNAEDDHVGLGAILPLKIDTIAVSGYDLYYYSTGEKSIATVQLHIPSKYEDNADEDYTLEYQTVMYRTGAIEFRYKAVNKLPSDVDYLVALTGLDYADYAAYHNCGDLGNKVHDGLVVRFEPNSDVSLITNANPSTGTISPGGIHKVSLTIDPKSVGVFGGSYQNEVVLKANITGGQTDLPLSINIQGNGSFNSPDTLDFGITNTDHAKEAYLILTNTGSADADLQSITINDSRFARVDAAAVTIKSDSKYLLPLTFTPDVAGTIVTTAVLTYTNGDSEIIRLEGEGQIDPNFSHNFPTTVTVDVNNDDVVSIPLSINSQAGTADLEYTITNGRLSSVYNESEKNAINTNSVSVDEAYGYTMSVSDTITRRTYKWEELLGKGENYIVESGETLELELPFEFPFYGSTYSKVWVSYNGYFSVNEPVDDIYYYDFTKEDGVSGMIAPLWNQLLPSDEEEGLIILKEDDRLLVQWNRFQSQNPNSNPGIITFQAEILADGTINFHYKDVENWGGLLEYGLESPDETEVFTDMTILPTVDDSPFSDSTTLVIAAPLKESLESGGTHNLDLKVGGVKMFKQGLYHDTVTVHTNSMQLPSVTLPIEINFTGSPVIAGDNSIVLDDVVYREGVSVVHSYQIQNVGYEDLVITHIDDQGIDELSLYNKTLDDEFIRGSNGELITPLTIEPWGIYTILIEVTVEEQENILGSLVIKGNADDKTISIKGNVIESPKFSWDATSQNLSMNNNDTLSYKFTIANSGVSPMSYNAICAVVPTGDDASFPVNEEVVGSYTKEAPIVADSLFLEVKEVGDGVLTPMAVGSYLSFANRFVAPEGGFYITHIKSFNYLRIEGEYLNIEIWQGGEKPDEGTLLYAQNFVIDEVVNKEWVYCELEKPIKIPEGEAFFVKLSPPLDTKFLGFDSSDDVEILENVFTGVQDSVSFRWYDYEEEGGNTVWKIRPLTASGSGQWVTLSPLDGEVEPGDSQEIEATIYGPLAGAGKHKANLIIKSNDIDNSNSQVDLTVEVNGAPEFIHYPNIDKDTVKVTELNELVLNFLYSDPEGEDMKIDLVTDHDSLDVTFDLTGNNTAQMIIATDYESAGAYEWEVKLSDESGNEVYKTVLVQIEDKNRAPIFNEEYTVITMNMANPNESFTIIPSDLFSDPDGDEFQLLSGNYTPEIVDLALGTSFLSIYPLQEGTGYIAVGADDGNEDGFVVYGIYVVVINDPDAVSANPDGVGSNMPLIDSESIFSMAPNPIKNGTTTAIFNLEEAAEVKIEIIDIAGQLRTSQEIGSYEKGLNNKLIDVSSLATGTYICRIVTNNTIKEITKIVIL